MIIFWPIRYIDRTDRQWKDRWLFLDTTKLPAAQKAAVELALETKAEREFLRFRPLFVEEKTQEGAEKWLGHGHKTFNLNYYHEDENGVALSMREIGHILTGSPTAIMLPAGTEQHHIDHMLSPPAPVPVAEITLTPGEIKTLGYFKRELRELTASAFWKDGAGTLHTTGSFTSSEYGEPELKTAVKHEEICSFVMTFRRLYMENEPANFAKSVNVFARHLHDHRLGKWVAGEKKSLFKRLKEPPWLPPYAPPSGKFGFSIRNLLDAFIYTRYAHQPDAETEELHAKCLAEVGGKDAVLTWLFLYELQNASLKMNNAGKQVVWWFDKYCEHHKVTPDVLASLLDLNPGIGSEEKESDKKARLLQAKVEEVAAAMWQEAGSPVGGPAQFYEAARKAIEAV